MVIDVFQGAAQAAAASRAARTAAPHTAVKMIKWTQNIESPAGGCAAAEGGQAR